MAQSVNKTDHEMEDSNKEPILGSKQADPSDGRAEGLSAKGGTSVFQSKPNSLQVFRGQLARIEKGDYIQESRKSRLRKRNIITYSTLNYCPNIFDKAVDIELFDQFHNARDNYQQLEYEFLSKLWKETGRDAGVVHPWMCFIQKEMPDKTLNRKYSTSIKDCQVTFANMLVKEFGCVAVPEFYHEGTISDCFAIIDDLGIDFEFKTNFKDYLGDFEKTMRICDIPVNKHVALANGLLTIAKHYFVVPEGLIKVDEVPAHSGLITFTLPELGNGMNCTVRKMAPVLNGPEQQRTVWKWAALGLMRKVTSAYFDVTKYASLTNKL